MPRNGSGTFTLVSGNPVVTGTTIESNWANTTLSDIATAMTDSLSRSGQGGMTAALRIADGTQGAPGIGFANETGSGLYRAGTAEVWAVVQGAQTLRLDASGVYVPADKTTTVDGAFVFNEAGADKDARFEGDTDTNLVFVDASTDRVGIGTNTPASKLDVVGDVTVSGTVNATTLDLTNLEVTNIKAKDGTASASIADSTGVMSLVANPVLSGGTANGVLYLNGSKVATSGAAITFDGTNFATTGSATATAFIPSGSSVPTNGMYLPAANTVAWSTNTTERARITSGGDLLIGTTSTVSGSKLVVDTGDATIYGVRVGRGAGAVSTNTAVGSGALNANTTASNNTAVGYQALYTNTTATGNVAVGFQAGFTSNATAAPSNVSANTFLGSQSGYFATSALHSTFVGSAAGYNVNTGSSNTLVGRIAGYNLTSGTFNTFVGPGDNNGGSGYLVSTGSKNTILGAYNGNQDGLDIRTASNYAIISDGDGNRLLSTANGYTLALDGGAVPQTGTGITFPATQSASSDANTLDDYEEGTWTPNQGAGLTVVGSFSSNGAYVKIGRQVTVYAQLTGSTSVAVNGSDAIMFTNLPFAVANRSVGGAVKITHDAGIFTSSSSTTVYGCGALAASTSIYFSLTYITS